MTKFGYKLMTEEHGPKALVENAVRAEQAGFDFVSISDHFHPWLESQGHSPFAWSVLGAIAHATSKIGICTGLTCPIIRYHPAIIAQAAATIAVMSDGRFTLAVGAGERLNEHVVGAAWPPIPQRHEMLGEAIEICRKLWSGKIVNYSGAYFDVDHAQLYDAPENDIDVIVGVSGEHSVALAAAHDAGMMATDADAQLVAKFREQAGDGAAVYGECSLAWAESEQAGLELARERFSFGALGWDVNSELKSVAGFEAATKFVKIEDLAEHTSAGPDAETHLKAVREFVDAGFVHVVLLGMGEDQAGFIDFCRDKLLPELRGG